MYKKIDHQYGHFNMLVQRLLVSTYKYQARNLTQSRSHELHQRHSKVVHNHFLFAQSTECQTEAYLITGMAPTASFFSPDRDVGPLTADNGCANAGALWSEVAEDMSLKLSARSSFYTVSLDPIGQPHV